MKLDRGERRLDKVDPKSIDVIGDNILIERILIIENECKYFIKTDVNRAWCEQRAALVHCVGKKVKDVAPGMYVILNKKCGVVETFNLGNHMIVKAENVDAVIGKLGKKYRYISMDEFEKENSYDPKYDDLRI